MGKAAKETPRWKRKSAPPGPSLTLRGRRAERRFAAIVAANLAAQPGHQPVPGSKVMARTGAFRFRLHLVPFEWLLSVLVLGLGMHYGHAFRAALITGTVAAVVIVLLSRHLCTFARGAAAALAVLTALWLPLLAAFGWARPLPALLFGCWACFVVPWMLRYRWRPEEKAPEPDLSDMQLWDSTLGAKGRLAGSRLCLPAGIPNGVKYTLKLRRGEQDTSDAFTMSKKIASLFGKPVTEVYPERFPDSREHEVMLTLLRKNTLARVRQWDGSSIDPATGLAAMADFPDGDAAHFRFWSPRNGAEQSIVVGVKGSGKSYLLHLLLSIAVTSEVPVIPIVLDPQQGQSLPDWRGEVLYARGVEECMAYLRAFEDGMMARSDYLADFAWTDEDGYERPGMDFYDPHLSGLPLMFMVFDEAHLVLNDPKHGKEAQRIVGNLVKLDRKAGGHLMLVSHTLLLTQLGDMTLRAMVVGGNAVALRTGEALSGGIVGLEADPKLLPRSFADGSETHGLGYIVGPDNRPDSPMRVRLVPNPRKVAVEAPAREMDAVFGDAFRASLTQQKGKASPSPAAASPAVTVVPPPEDDGPEGRTCADAILAVLHGEMTRGQIIADVKVLTEGDWRRPRTFSTKAIQNALNALVDAGRIAKPRDGAYAPSRPTLHAVGPTSHN